MPFSPINPNGRFKCPYCTRWVTKRQFYQHLYHRHKEIHKKYLKTKILAFLVRKGGWSSFHNIRRATNMNSSILCNILEEMIKEGKISFYSVEIGNKTPKKNPKGIYMIRGEVNE